MTFLKRLLPAAMVALLTIATSGETGTIYDEPSEEYSTDNGNPDEEELQALLFQGNTKAGLAKLNKLIDDNPQEFEYYQLKLALLAQMENFAAIRKTYGDIFKNFRDDSEELNILAWMAATSPFETRDLELALDAVDRAVELSKSSDAAVLDTRARVYYEIGFLDKAIEQQKEALSAGGISRAERNAMKTTLAYYESTKALRARLNDSEQASHSTQEKAK